MSFVCPNGHTSEADDFCDTCGAKIDKDNQPAASSSLESSGAAGPSPGAGPPSAEAPAQQLCPNCGTANSPDALFCEACGYDFTTGALPRGATPHTGASGAEASAAAGGAAAETQIGNISPALGPAWVAEVWVDPDWYDVQEAAEPMPSPGLPVVVPLLNKSLLVGRVSVSRNIHPDIDCATDTGVSRRHAQLTSDGQRWFVEDLGSSNGTYVGPASGPLPDGPIAVGPKTELDEDDRIYVGAWTRIVVRAATDDERAASA